MDGRGLARRAVRYGSMRMPGFNVSSLWGIRCTLGFTYLTLYRCGTRQRYPRGARDRYAPPGDGPPDGPGPPARGWDPGVPGPPAGNRGAPARGVDVKPSPGGVPGSPGRAGKALKMAFLAILGQNPENRAFWPFFPIFAHFGQNPGFSRGVLHQPLAPGPP